MLVIVPGRVPGVVLCWLGVGAVGACVGRFKAVLLCGRVGVGGAAFPGVVRRSMWCRGVPGGGFTTAAEPGGSCLNSPKKIKRPY